MSRCSLSTRCLGLAQLVVPLNHDQVEGSVLAVLEATPFNCGISALLHVSLPVSVPPTWSNKRRGIRDLTTLWTRDSALGETYNQHSSPSRSSPVHRRISTHRLFTQAMVSTSVRKCMKKPCVTKTTSRSGRDARKSLNSVALLSTAVSSWDHFAVLLFQSGMIPW